MKTQDALSETIKFHVGKHFNFTKNDQQTPVIVIADNFAYISSKYIKECLTANVRTVESL